MELPWFYEQEFRMSQYMCLLDMCYSLNVVTVHMCVYVLCVCLFIYINAEYQYMCALDMCVPG